ncbi:HAMP domain-containing sensor histidine kinase [Leucobacter sp. wl10]|uniref:sensor histidine kinase n=1 Tax=Leucobacter sp. wl10 TaxID=2304677 RepID=UPI000E5B1F18|nr:HAMP domain-containing sensor histidine kinase [Leucobacter sp. wl10]RGE18981.1 sensor histidine kinase [Leucobacter sp. wl10]
MRLRVLLPMLALGLLVIGAILIPTGNAIAESRTQQIQLQRAASANQIVQRASATTERGEVDALERYLARFYDTYGESVLVVDEAGGMVAAVGDIALAGDAAQAVTAALRGVPQWRLPTVYPWSEDTVYVAEPIVTDGAVSGAVALRVNQSVARADVVAGWTLAGGIGAALLALLLLASVLWTNWVLRPVLALDAATNALARHRAFDLNGASGPPELRRLAESFTRMARNVETALEQQRGLVADASHQLRNPLAAIRLRIDTMPRSGAEPEFSAVDADLDRLEHTVERLLTLADAEHRANLSGSPAAAPTAAGEPHGSDTAPVCAVSGAGLAAPHRELLAAAGIDLVARGPAQRVVCRRRDLDEMLEILVDNARKYVPAGAVLTISLARRAERVALTVSDSGAGLSTAELSRVGTRFWRGAAHAQHPGSGLGYAIVAQLARANRSTVTVDRAPEGGLRTTILMEAA